MINEKTKHILITVFHLAIAVMCCILAWNEAPHLNSTFVIVSNTAAQLCITINTMDFIIWQHDPARETQLMPWVWICGMLSFGLGMCVMANNAPLYYVLYVPFALLQLICIILFAVGWLIYILYAVCGGGDEHMHTCGTFCKNSCRDCWLFIKICRNQQPANCPTCQV